MSGEVGCDGCGVVEDDASSGVDCLRDADLLIGQIPETSFFEK